MPGVQYLTLPRGKTLKFDKQLCIKGICRLIKKNDYKALADVTGTVWFLYSSNKNNIDVMADLFCKFVVTGQQF